MQNQQEQGQIIELTQLNISSQINTTETKNDQAFQQRLKRRQSRMKAYQIDFYSPFEENDGKQEEKFTFLIQSDSVKKNAKIPNKSSSKRPASLEIDLEEDNESLDRIDSMDLQLSLQDYLDVRCQQIERQKGATQEIRMTCIKPQDNMYEQEWVKRQEKIFVAFSFVNRGYGAYFWKEQLNTGNYVGIHLDEIKYKSYTGSIARQSFRRLESFLLRDCKKKIYSFTGYEIKVLQTMLLNCRSTLRARACKLFLQVVKITFNLEDCSLSQKEGMQLYSSIYDAMQQKMNGVKRVERSDEIDLIRQEQHKRPTPLFSRPHTRSFNNISQIDLEKEIIKEYIVEKSVSKTRDSLKLRLRLDQRQMNTKIIRNTLRRILRSGIRIIETVMTKINPDIWQKYPKLTDQKIKYLIEAAESHDLRSQLCKIYLSSGKDHRFIQTVMKHMYIIIEQRYLRHNTSTYQLMARKIVDEQLNDSL